MWPWKKKSTPVADPSVVRLADWAKLEAGRYLAVFEGPDGRLEALVRTKENAAAKRYVWRSDADGIRLTVPKRTTQKAIRALVSEHATSFAAAAQRARSHEAAMRAAWPAPFGEAFAPAFDERTGLWHFGPYSLTLSSTYDKDELEAAQADRFRKEAKAHFEVLQARWAAVYGVASPAIQVRRAMKFWGKCYWSRPQIVYSIQTYFLPLALQEYVVAHELAHLFVHDHSPAFWAKLESVMPDAREKHRQSRAWKTPGL